MADLSWLTEAVNKTRNAQLKQQKLVAIPLYNQISQTLNDLQSPVTPQVQQLFQMIQQQQKQNPVYIPFKPGTPTLAKQQFTEGVRQWEQEFAENKRRWEQEFAAQEQQRRIANALASQGQGTSIDSGNDLPGTAGERKNYYYGLTMKKYQDEIKNLFAQKGRTDRWDTDKRYYWKEPSQDDINRKLYDIEQDIVENLPTLRKMGLNNDDILNIFKVQVFGSLGSEGQDIYDKWKKEHNARIDINSMLTKPQSDIGVLYDILNQNTQ